MSATEHVLLHAASEQQSHTLSPSPLRGFSDRSEATFLPACFTSCARPLALPVALSAAAPGLGRLDEVGFMPLPTSLAAPFA